MREVKIRNKKNNVVKSVDEKFVKDFLGTGDWDLLKENVVNQKNAAGKDRV
jgi:hypothetical protein